MRDGNSNKDDLFGDGNDIHLYLYLYLYIYIYIIAEAKRKWIPTIKEAVTRTQL